MTNRIEIREIDRFLKKEPAAERKDLMALHIRMLASAENEQYAIEEMNSSIRRAFAGLRSGQEGDAAAAEQ